jgi:hypothetical protein
MLQPEHARVNRIVAKIAFGIFIRRYGVVPAPEEVQPIGLFPYNIDDHRPPGFFVLAFTERFLPKRWTHVQKGVFSYLIARAGQGNNDLYCLMDIHRTAWGVAKIPNPAAWRNRQAAPTVSQMRLPFRESA